MVITDHFTRFAVASPTKNQTAKTTADALYNELIVRYGIMARLHADQGANFESSIIKELCKIMGIEKSRTTPYHASGIGMTERFNRALISMLGTLDTEQKKDWKQYVAPLVHAYNCIKHESTGFSPYLLLFGRDPKLPIDVSFGIDKDDSNNQAYTEYVTDLQNRIKETFEVVNRNAAKAREKQKAYYDIKARAAKLEPGDRVLVEILAFDGKHKIADKWSEDVFIVIDQPNIDILTYRVRRENGLDGDKFLLLHRNHLLHLGNSLQNKAEDVLDYIDPNKGIDSKQIDEQTQNTVSQSDLSPEAKTGSCNEKIPVMEKEESIVPSSGEEESEDDEEVVVIQTTTVDENTEVGTSVTEVFVPEVTDEGSQTQKLTV